jgi:hypothetical protein
MPIICGVNSKFEIEIANVGCCALKNDFERVDVERFIINDHYSVYLGSCIFSECIAIVNYFMLYFAVLLLFILIYVWKMLKH